MSGVSTVGQMNVQIALIKAQQTQITDLSRQLATGRKAADFSDLGVDALPLQRSRTQINALSSYTRNIDTADRRLESMINDIQEMKEHIQNMSSALLSFGSQGTHQRGETVYDTTTNPPQAIGMTSQEMDTAFENLQRTARTLFPMIQNIMNKQENGRYVFAGDQTDTAPYQDSGALDSAIADLLSSWRGGSISTQSLTSALQERDPGTVPGALSDATVGYATEIASGRVGKVVFRPDVGVEIDYTTLANDPGMRDVVVALAYLRNPALGPVADVIDPTTHIVTTNGAPGTTLQDMQENFYEVMETVAGLLEGSITHLQKTVEGLQMTRSYMGEMRTRQEQDTEILNQMIGDIENIDPNTVAIQLQSVNTQLNISLSVTAMIQKTSLLNYL